ncbi:hypothetical protein ASD56_03880 [Microbacterium sp. Root166]|uniref:DUF5979 domain-containing protein n=1 Tax=Microbacterium sp. Root166 TaxID=1736478 RepID=UPI0006F30ED8|nr:DUF5979 domain-containing protein [Microbacterium sp. Root166]KQZ85479.1 hypothetical protein ASD56_03880 [Microbacterium sp. Root166]
MSLRRRLIRARSAAVLSVGAMVLAAGVVVIGAPTAAIANECTPAGANPMGASVPLGSEAAYTIYTTGDAILSNPEIEGTLAIGGTATFGDPRGNANLQYPIYHGGIGGNADYDLPQIDGVDNRVLLNRFASDPATPKIVQVQVQDGLPVGGAKIIDQTTPAGYVFGPSFDSAGTTYYPSTGGNQSPQLDSRAQLWNGGAGEATFDTALTDFGAYFPEDTGAALLSETDYVAPNVVPGGTPNVALNASGPNQIALVDLWAGLGDANVFTMSSFSAQAPLIVKVSPADVVGGVLTLPSYANAGKDAPGNEGISYLLFDLSDITGDVTIVAPDRPVRGSIYAPDAHVIFPPSAEGGKEFEGQLIASSFSALQNGEEIHTNLFLGLLPCSLVEPGGFTLQKALVGVTPADFPDGTVFEVTASWSVEDVPTSQVFELPVDGSMVAGPTDLPVGTVVTFTEATAPDAAGFDFVGVAFSPTSVTIGADTVTAVTATNTYAPEPVETGGFSLQKALSGVTAADFPDGTVFEVTASWSVGGVPASQVFQLPATGGVVNGPTDLPVGTVVTFSEVTAPEAEGFDFVGVAFSPSSVTIGADTVTAVTATNTYAPEDSGGGGGGGAGGGSDSGLPATGVDVAGTTFIGAILLLVGGLAFAAAKRRRLS